MLPTMLTNLLGRFAAACEPGAGSSGGFFGFPTWYKHLEGTRDIAGKCSVVFAGPEDIGKILLAVVEILLRIAALVAVGFVIYGGFQYILSQGEPDRARAARGTIINSLIGVVIALIATAVVTYIVKWIVI